MFRRSLLFRPVAAVLAPAALSCLVLLLAAPGASRAQDPEPALDLESRADSASVRLQRGRAESDVPVFEDAIEVGLRTYRVQVVDRRGQPIEGLGKRDFDVKLGSEFIHVDSVRWVRLGRPSDLVLDDGRRNEFSPAGRYLLFVQAGREPFFGRTHMRLQRQIREFLDGLDPGAAVGVVSYDARLKLWLDFTRDREMVERVVSVAGRFTAEPGAQPGRERDLPSLREIWDGEESRQIQTAEQGLETMARYLDHLPGTDTMIYVGWGLSHFSRRSALRIREFNRATESLANAGVQVFVLGVVESDLQTLGNGLLELADATGGAYFHSRDIAASRMRELASSLSAHYLLTLDEADLADAIRREPKRDPHRDLEIELRFRDGRIYGPPRPVE